MQKGQSNLVFDLVTRCDLSSVTYMRVGDCVVAFLTPVVQDGDGLLRPRVACVALRLAATFLGVLGFGEEGVFFLCSVRHV